MLSITHHQVNASDSHSKVSLSTEWSSYYQEDKGAVLEKCGEKGFQGECKLVQASGKTVYSHLKNFKTELACDMANPPPSTQAKETK